MTKFNRLKTYAYLEKCYGKFQVPISKIQVDNVTSLLREKTSPTVYKFFKDHKKLGLLKALTINQHNSLAVLHQIEFRKFI